MSEYFILETGVRVVGDKPNVVLDLVKYTTNPDEVREICIETEIEDFHKLMLQDFKGWGAPGDVNTIEMRNKRKLRSYQENGAPVNSTKVLSEVYSLDFDLVKAAEGKVESIQASVGADQIKEIHITAFVDSKIDDIDGRGKFTTFMSQLSRLERVLKCSVRYPRWYTDKLSSERSTLEYQARQRKMEENLDAAKKAQENAIIEAEKKKAAEAAEAARNASSKPTRSETPVQAAGKSDLSEFIDRVTLIADIFEGVMEEPHTIIVKPDGEVDVKLVFKHPRFEELKNGLKTELKYKWRVTEKVWRGSLKDIGKAVRPDFTLKMLLDYIHRNPSLKAQLEDEVRILLEVLAKGGLRYQQP